MQRATALTLCIALLAVAAPPSGADADAASEGAYEIPLWGTWNRTELDVVIVPPATGPLYDQRLRPAPEGRGLAADSPYVQATKDAIAAWESAVDAYVEAYPDAAHLQRFAFHARVLGDGATPADLASADIRVAYGPTGGAHLGLAVQTDRNAEGALNRCDVVNFQWLGFSYTLNDLYNIHAQEFGHCLGLHHPEAPHDDIMEGTYDYFPGDPATPRVCVSALDVRGLDVAYAWLGEDGSWRAPPDAATLAKSAYTTYAAVNASDGCPNPDAR